MNDYNEKFPRVDEERKVNDDGMGVRARKDKLDKAGANKFDTVMEEAMDDENIAGLASNDHDGLGFTEGGQRDIRQDANPNDPIVLPDAATVNAQ